MTVIPTDVPGLEGERPGVRTGVELYGASNNGEFGGALRLDGGFAPVGWQLLAVGRKSEALHTPDGELENTGFGAFKGEAALGVRGDRSSATLRYTHRW